MVGPEFPRPDRAIGFDDLAPLLASAGVDCTVLVQSADSAADNEAMFEIAAKHAEIAEVVAWLPLDRPAELEPMLDELLGRENFVGVRNLIHVRPDPDWVVSATVSTSLGLLEHAGAPFDLVTVLPRHLEHVTVLCERHPGLRLVIDHLAKPPIGTGDLEPWASLLARAAEFPNVYAKLSGLYPGGDDLRRWSAEDIHPIVHYAMELFGAERLMSGSDWPVGEVAGGYGAVVGTLFDIFEDFAGPERAFLLGGTTSSVYGLSVEEK